MSIIWPSNLPSSPLIQGYNETMKRMTISSQMDSGPALKRRRFTSAPRSITCTVFLSNGQDEVLREFYEDTTLGGTLRFTWKNPRTGAQVEMRFEGEEPPAITPVNGSDGTQFISTLNLEILP